MNKYQTACVSLSLSDGIELYGAICTLLQWYWKEQCVWQKEINIYSRHVRNWSVGEVEAPDSIERWRATLLLKLSFLAPFHLQTTLRYDHAPQILHPVWSLWTAMSAWHLWRVWPQLVGAGTLFLSHWALGCVTDLSMECCLQAVVLLSL